MLLIAALAIVWNVLGGRWSILYRLVSFSPHLVMDPEWPLFKGLLRGGRFASQNQNYNQKEDQAGADDGQAADNQCDAQNGHFDQASRRHFRPVLGIRVITG
jgi:hypothetical protein